MSVWEGLWVPLTALPILAPAPQKNIVFTCRHEDFQLRGPEKTLTPDVVSAVASAPLM